MHFKLLNYRNQDLLRVRDLMQIFQCSRSTIYNWISNDLMVSPMKISGSVFFPTSQVEGLLEAISSGADDSQLKYLVQSYAES